MRWTNHHGCGKENVSFFLYFNFYFFQKSVGFPITCQILLLHERVEYSRLPKKHPKPLLSRYRSSISGVLNAQIFSKCWEFFKKSYCRVYCFVRIIDKPLGHLGQLENCKDSHEDSHCIFRNSSKLLIYFIFELPVNFKLLWFFAKPQMKNLEHHFRTNSSLEVFYKEIKGTFFKIIVWLTNFSELKSDLRMPIQIYFYCGSKNIEISSRN